MTCRTRFAPSPTGFLHIGGARTALYCYLEARRRGGQFILRIEDTDRERSTQESVDAIIDGMEWLQLDYDEGPYFQTQRFDRYRTVAHELIAAGHAYRCWCPKERLDKLREEQMAAGGKPRYDGLCRSRTAPPDADAPSVIRFRNPDAGTVVFDDRVRGHIEISNSELDDLILWRSDDHPTYNFAVVVDDIDMHITDVIRGEDHINNTPRQINIYRALGKEPPRFAHLPMIHGPDGAKLSKRHGAVSVMQYRDDGYLPHALLNYIARLGWSHGDQEIFSRRELIELFSVDDVNKSASRFDFDKLAWLNQHYMKSDPPDAVAAHLEWHLHALNYDLDKGPKPADVVVALRDRVKTLKEMAERAKVWYLPLEGYDPQAAAKQFAGRAADALTAARDALARIADADWRADSVDAALKRAAEAIGEGLGKVAQPLRVAITGTAVSPSIDHTVYLCGKRVALERIDAALRHIRAVA
jgi:glutamyl-tRNA synthetase